jgi:small-conductance mechanosensitive channel
VTRARIELGAAVLAIVCLAMWVGGLVALGACAAPLVFRIVPAPLSGEAMGAVFRRFDGIAISCAIVVLGCEAVRIFVSSRSPAADRVGRAATVFERTRTTLAVVAAAAAIYGGAHLSPAIVALHAGGAVRGFGADGLELERLHKIAESIAKIEVSAGLLLLALHVTTLVRMEPKPA